MITLSITFLLAGLLAGLIQYFVDFKGLPIYSPENSKESIVATNTKGILQSIVAFIKRNWQLFGYIIVGISGSFLVPVIDQLLNLKGVEDFLLCLKVTEENNCKNREWNLLILLGYGIISGYSSVRIIRSFGSLILGNLSKTIEEQKLDLERMRKKLEALIASKPTEGNNESSPQIENEFLENAHDEAHYCDAEWLTDGLEDIFISACEKFPQPWTNKKWRIAECLKKLISEINNLAPTRSKNNDGTIADIAHQKTNSDHNPWVKDPNRNMGIVTALDITHDPNNKCDCNVIAKFLQEKKDNRIKYVIWNNRIMNSQAISGHDAWVWRDYSGKNPHDKHIHISVKCELQYCDNPQNWNLEI